MGIGLLDVRGSFQIASIDIVTGLTRRSSSHPMSGLGRGRYAEPFRNAGLGITA